MAVANEGQRFQPLTTGEHEMPVDCCSYGVVDWAKGKEICRVWEEGDARLIANLLNEAFEQNPLQWTEEGKAAAETRVAQKQEKNQ